jgi:hypothetical protein
MRLGFTDLERIKRRANKRRKSELSILERWFTKKYNLPPTHEAFLSRPQALHLREFFEDLYIREEELELELKQASGPDKASIAQSLQAIRRILSGEDQAVLAPTGDPLVDKWLREMEAGQTPDLTERLNR